MNVLSIIYFLAFLIYLWLICFIIYKNPKSSINRICALYLSCFAVWALAWGFFLISPSQASAKLWMNISSFGWSCFGVVFLLFAVIFAKRERILRKNRLLFLSFWLIPLILIYKQWSGFLMVDFVETFYGRSFSWSRSIWTVLFYVYYLLSVSIGLYFCFDFKKKARRILEKRQANNIAVIGLIALILGSITDGFLRLFEIHIIPPVAPIIVLAWAGGVVYAIIKYGFLINILETGR